MKKPTLRSPRRLFLVVGGLRLGRVLPTLIVCLTLAEVGQSQVVVEQDTSRTRLSNKLVTLEFDNRDGAWVGLLTEGLSTNLIARDKLGPAADFRVDEQWMTETHGSTLLKQQTVRNEKTGAVTLQLSYGVCKLAPLLYIPARWKDRAPAPMPTYAPPAPYEFVLTVSYTLRPGERRIERSASVVRNLSKNFFRSSFRKLDGFLLLVPSAVVGTPEECTVEVPGPIYTYTYIDAQTPYMKLAGTFIDSKTAPDRFPGIVGIENRQRGLTLSTWVDTKAEAANQTYLSGDGERISLLVHTLRSDRLGDNTTVDSDVQTILLTDSFRAAQTEHRAVIAATMPLSETTPDWVREMVILEMMPGFYPGGFKELAEHLPFYRDLGFNTLYLLPHWPGSYGNADPLSVDPKFGTPQELKALVARAHGLGMRVLFDMVIHGFGKDGPIARQHPEFFTRNDQGLIETHFNWGSLNTDPGSPDYQQFMVDLVLHDLHAYDIDGYRIDANSYKSPNWDPQSPRRPWQASSTLPVYRRMYEALQREKPDVVLYSEMFGPVWHSVSNLAQDANWAVVTDLFDRMDKGEVNAATYKAGMAQLQESLQPGANRIRFCRNHDTCWFFPKHWRGYTPRFLALDGVHALFGVPVVFAGDRDFPPALADDKPAVDHYRQIMAVRKQFPEFARGEVLLREISCDQPWIFTGLRKLDDRYALAVVSLSDKPLPATLKLDVPGYQLAGQTLLDAKTGATTTIDGDRLTVGPFQTLCGRLTK